METGTPTQTLLVLLLVCCLPQGRLTSAEESCPANAWPPHEPNGQVRFGLLLSKNIINFDDDLSSDCVLTSFALQHYLAVEWLVDRLNQANNGSGYIPGITIGFDALNDCSLPKYAARNSISIYNNYDPSTGTLSSCASETKNTTYAGMVMIGSSAVVREVASITNDSSVPIISSTATLTELNNRQLYPNFLRTVPSDIYQMAFIADILKQLSWTYIVVAYQDNLYGISGLHDLQQKAQENDICIHESLKLPKQQFDIQNVLFDIIRTAKDQSIAVVIIADIPNTENVLCALSKSSSGKFHFILTEAVNKYIFESCMHGSWTFSVSTDPDVELSELKSYINTKYQNERAKNPNERKHPLIAEYLRLDEAPRTGNLVDGSLTAYITSSINAVFALMESVRRLHAETCGDQQGLCTSLIPKMKEDRLLNLLSSGKFNYTQIEAGIIPLEVQNLSFKFNAETGEISYLENFKQYTVCYFSNQEYKHVGDFADGSTHLDLSKVTSLSAGPVPTSVCAGRCDTCLNNGKVPIVFIPGDAYIIGVLSIHEPKLFECGAWRKIGNDAFVAEGFIYAIRRLSEQTGFKFGAIGIDDCYSPLRIMSLLTDYLSNINPLNSNLFPFHVPREKIVGAIGCRSSGCTLATASVFMPLKLPLISYGASSPDLDDKVNYPYFLRTVPSDVYQAQVMVDIIKDMGWEYVGLLYVQNNYGSKGMLAFRHIVDQVGSGICVPKEYGITEENNEENDKGLFFEAYTHFRTLQVKVIVFFGIDERFKSFIESIENDRVRRGNFIFLASEEWGNNSKILNAGHNAARGSITLKLQDVGVASKEPFTEYLKTRVPIPNDTNVWFNEFWQNQFSCNFKGGFINEFERECQPSFKLNDEEIDELVNEQRLSHVMNAVFAMGNALNEIKDRNCKDKPFPCEYLSTSPEEVVEKIRTQKLPNGQENIFDSEANGAIGFEVFNIQTNDGGLTYEYVKVGSFPRSDKLDKEQFKFYDASGNTISLTAACTGDRCDKCQHRASPTEPSLVTPASKEQSDSDYTDSDILIISLIIVLIIAIAIIVAVFVLCFKRKYKNFEKTVMVAKDDQLYAEVYPGAYNASANRLRFSDPNFSPYQDSNPSGEGLSNPAYAPDSDNVDSVSQAAMRRHNIRPNAKTFGPPSSDDSGSTTHRTPMDQRRDVFGSPILHNAGRPLPSTAIGRGNAHTESEVGAPWSSNASSVSQPQAVRGPPIDAGHLNGHYLSPSELSLNVASTPQQDSNRIAVRMPSSNQGEEPVIYYIRDANGHLAALVPSNSVTRMSVRSDASSSVVADHGPYSDALAQQKALMRSQIPETIATSPYSPQALIAMPVQTALASNALPQHENLELQEMPQSQPRPHRAYSHAQGVVETPLSNNSPIHYASPVHNPVSGHGDEGEAGHQHLQYHDQATAVPMGDPSVNHFRQNSDAYRKQDHFGARDDTIIQNDQFTRNVGNPINASEMEREGDLRQIEPLSIIPDVVSSSPSHSTTPNNHVRSSSEIGKESEKLHELGTDVLFLQNSQGQSRHALIHTPISSV